MWSIMTVLVYLGVIKLNKHVKLPLFNSVLYATIVLVVILSLIKVDYETYKASAGLIANSLGPFVILLAIPLYKYKETMKKNGKAIVLGMLTSSFVSLAIIVILSIVFKVEKELILTLIPKSITTPIAISMSEILGGIPSITVITVIITGITGAALMPVVVRILKIDNQIAIGVALGATAHGVGTSRALEFSDEAGAVSGLTMGLTGTMYILIASIVAMFI